MHYSPFLSFLGLWGSILDEIDDAQIYLQTRGLNMHQCDVKLKSLEIFLITNRDKLIQESVTFAKNICNDLGIDMRPTRRPRKKKQMFGEHCQDAGLPYECELRREMFLSLDKVIQ